MSLTQIRKRFKIPNYVEISYLNELSDSIEEGEAAVSFAQLEYGLSIPIDTGLCSLLSLWGVPLSQIHPSILIAIKRIRTIVSVFNLPFDATDICRILLPSLRTSSNGKKSYFICSWKDPNRRLTEFPHNSDGWTKHCFKLKNWQSNPLIHISQKLAVETPKVEIGDDAGSEARLNALFGVDSRLLRVSFPESYVQWFFTHETERERPLGPFPAVPLSQVPLYPFDEDHKIESEPLATQRRKQVVESSVLPRNDQAGSSSTSSSACVLRIPRQSKNHLVGPCNFRKSPTSSPTPIDKPIRKRLNKGPRKRKTPLINTNITDALSRKDRTPVRRSSRLKPVINYAESKLFKACIGRGINVANDSSETEKMILLLVVMMLHPLMIKLPFQSGDKLEGAATFTSGEMSAPPVLDISDSDSSKLVLGSSLAGVKRKRVFSPSNDGENTLTLAQKIHDQLGVLIAHLRGNDNPSREELLREINKLKAEKMIMSDEISSLSKEVAVAQEKSGLYREQVKVILHHYTAEPSTKQH